ncbi:Na+/H+ antiporter subunit E [Streptomyces carminius]|uniref:Na+/H+ antiporter subunit E n=1 Tax=Streptomyces carminius TaxID=2665496 RepID=A0A2M8M5X9_9ACTN|nr:Na+/H+ antiporter subunit E [Streptomyces carminius]PJE99594.1 Na+/H+ antiporter subunit E [Streptomyces carminius]
MTPVREGRSPGTASAGLWHQAWLRWPVAGWLWLLWVVLWGSVSPVVILGGLLVALLVVLLFPLPPITHRLAVHPLWVVAMAGHLLVDLTGSALIVAREAVLRGPRVRAAVLEAPLRVDTDLLITAASHLTTMTPGSMVLEIDRGERLFYIHSLPVRDAAEAEAQRGDVASAERRVRRALAPGGRGGGAPDGDVHDGKEQR